MQSKTREMRCFHNLALQGNGFNSFPSKSVFIAQNVWLEAPGTIFGCLFREMENWKGKGIKMSSVSTHSMKDLGMFDKAGAALFNVSVLCIKIAVL